MGLVIILALTLYIAISMGVIAWAVSYAKKQGKSAKRWGWGAALGMYLLVFWDWMPTVVMHQYYCATQAGFWVYKTPEQWKKENPGVMEGLVYDNTTPDLREGDDDIHIDTNVLNQRFNWVTEKQSLLWYLKAYRLQSQIIDISNGKAVARWVDFSSGKGRDYWKFWMNVASCPDGTTGRNNLFQYADELIKMTDTSKRNDK
ncbi:MAG: hypothetical protein Q8M99_10050 [Methylotenera sp.]|nr:hypothetical protein [Methylotenera sp.]